MPKFYQRSHQSEWMDDLLVSFEEFHSCLQDLERVNVLTLAYRPTLHWMRSFLKNQKPLSVLDVGSGGGDMLRRIAKWAQRHNQNVALTGVDLNPFSRQSALLRKDNKNIQHETSNIFSFAPDRHYDCIVSSLFTHHLTDDEIVRFIQWMEQHATHGWFVNDLHRHPLPYYVVKYVMPLLRLDRMVVHDGPISVARAFNAKDWRALILKAGLSPQTVTVKWYFPFRYCIARIKS